MSDAILQSNDLSHESNNISVTVIIPVYNDEAALALCLRALDKQTLPKSQFEIIVVDNGSDTLPRVEMSANSRLLTETIPGSYAARNTGIKEAAASVIAFTDADCIPEPNWLAQGLTYLDEHPRASTIGGRVEVFPRNDELCTPVELYEVVKAFPQDEYVEKHRFAATANLFVRSTVFEAIGPFNPTLRSGGDVEFGQHSVDAGYRMEYAQSVVVRHPARRTLRSILHKTLRTMAGIRDRASLHEDPFPFPLSGTVKALVLPIRSIVRALGNDDIGSLVDRLKYTYVLLVIRYARAIFRLRLAFGARSPR